MRFAYPTDIHPKCRGWLERSAEYVATLTPDERAAWLRQWIPEVRHFPLTNGITAFDVTRVVSTLENWAEVKEAA